MLNYKQALEKLFALHTFGVKLGLDNVTKFLNYLDNPQKKLKAIHVAGSNGKGSTSAFIASILQEVGYKVGLYSSPHFVKFNERIVINGIQIDDNYIVKFINDHHKTIDKYELTFFEVTTALAFQYFKDENVDYAVIETGLGGRLDATNVFNPVACVITSISLEHTNVLGDKISGIAYEKGEIIKSGAKVFIGKLPAEADSVIENKCASTKCQLFRIEDYTMEKKGKVELYTEELELIDWEIPLKGNYQKYNAALAGLVVTKTIDLDNNEIIENGIKNVIENTGIQGRYEYFNTEPWVILDSAHNPEGVKSFINEFKLESKIYKKKTLIFGAMRDKQISEMFELVKNVFDEILVTQIEYERSADLESLIQAAKTAGIEVKICNNHVEYLKNFLTGDKSNCLVVLGSMYLIGEIKSANLLNA